MGVPGVRRRHQGRPLRPAASPARPTTRSRTRATELGVEWTPAGQSGDVPRRSAGSGPGCRCAPRCRRSGRSSSPRCSARTRRRRRRSRWCSTSPTRPACALRRPRRPARGAAVPHERRRQGRAQGHRRPVVGHRRRAAAQDRRARAAGRGGVLRRARARHRRPDADARADGKGVINCLELAAVQDKPQAVLDVPDVAARRPVPDAAGDRRRRQAEARASSSTRRTSCSRTHRRSSSPRSRRRCG